MQPERFDLPKLLGSIEPEKFVRDSWEKQPLAVSRDDPAYYHGLFARRDLDSAATSMRRSPRIAHPFM